VIPLLNILYVIVVEAHSRRRQSPRWCNIFEVNDTVVARRNCLDVATWFGLDQSQTQ
jgi:hypothetical protein